MREVRGVRPSLEVGGGEEANGKGACVRDDHDP